MTADLTLGQMPTAEPCRACNDEGTDTPAEVIVWGKMFDRADLGPRCYDHLPETVKRYWPHKLYICAVYDLRPANRLRAAVRGE